ncbi:MAG TPA: DUF2909 domain-containing protein [Thauera sp.]|nr:DUF2909 domain-containing protein [Thauera sp.]
MFIKILLVILLAVVIVSLFQALYVILKNDGSHTRMSRYLARRVYFSVAVMALLVVLLATGVLTTNPRPY